MTTNSTDPGTRLGVAVIGCGYWGPNLVRNFHQLETARVVGVADLDPGRLSYIADLYPGVGTTNEYRRLLDDPAVHAVVVATPVQRHAQFAIEALNAGKHVLVEKPMASSEAECRAMIVAAEQARRVLMVGHTFEYTEPVRRMKAILDEGMLGQLYYVASQRLNLGLFRNDVNVVWDLAPHDISILLRLTGGAMPVAVSTTGAAHINPKVHDVAMLTLEFEAGLIAFVQVSWLDPRKVRQTTLVGSKRMLVYDDLEPTEKIRIHDRDVDGPPPYQTFDEFPYTFRDGDITIPRIGGAEPLRTQAQQFVDCARSGKTPVTDGASGARVVRILEASSQSLRENGARIVL